MVVRVKTDERPLDTPSSEESGLGNSCDTSGSDHDSSEQEAALVVPPDGGWGWVVVAASFLCNMLVDGIIFSAAQINDYIRTDWPEVSEAKVAFVTSLLSGFYLLAGPFVSAIANRYGFRIVTIVGAVIGCAAFCLSYFATSVEYLYLIYGVIGGIGFCMMYMPAVIAVGFYFERWRALATGLSLCGSGVGTLAVAPLTNVILARCGWKVTVVIHGLMVLLCAICGLMFRPIKPVTVSMPEEETEAEVAKRHEEAVEKLNSMFKIQQKLDSGLSLPLEMRHHRGTPHTWMGVASNTTYPTAAEVFRGSGNALNRRASANAAALKASMVPRAPRYTVVPVAEKDELEDSTGSGENTAPLIERNDVEIRSPAVKAQNPRASAEPVSRPFYRDDIFFSGSLVRLPQYRSHTSIGYHLAVTHVPTRTDVQEERRGCRLCPEAVKRTLATMLDVSLFRSPTFVILAVSGFFTMLGFFVPYAYVTRRANETFEWNTNDSMWLVATIGAANVVGRIMCGMLSSVESISTLWLNNLAVTMGGIVTILSGLSSAIAFQYTYCVLFGFAVACFASLRVILVVDYMGLEKLTNCFGLLLLFQGVGAMLGAPIAGALHDFTKDYTACFYLAGSFLLFSALLCYPINYVSRWEKSRSTNNNRA